MKQDDSTGVVKQVNCKCVMRQDKKLFHVNDPHIVRYITSVGGERFMCLHKILTCSANVT
jgi:hypothetical protein